jgi:hypothetical protein
MPVRLNERGFQHARQLVDDGRYELDHRDEWSEHQPSTEQENEFIAEHGIGEYQKWHLGVDDEEPADRKSRWKFPYGDFDKVHRCGVLAAEVRAGQYRYQDIETAAPASTGTRTSRRRRPTCTACWTRCGTRGAADLRAEPGRPAISRRRCRPNE